MKVINYQTQPVVLDGGVVLAAAGTDGSVREVESLTDRDRKLEAKGLISVETPAPAVTAAHNPVPDEAQASAKKGAK
ncbi:MAG: hypothetical protein DMF64_18905 [Acidobacteria bacterium]|nr:MAG: hypothetical protein DMF64_18905 [Acidobacteriota bacterium]